MFHVKAARCRHAPPLAALPDAGLQDARVFSPELKERRALFLIFLELPRPISGPLSDFVHNSPTIAIGDKAFPNGSCWFVGSVFRHSRIKKMI